ncbi:hypothetical protein [Bacillus atrophaeus]|uniref:hypothetical protein n=1 Tax=Bacillus atrophaeus TaxID=1452 RepID=UPI0022813AAD|nr:hypothetical protein [Bacillus atrophaeus]MCY8958239.1 ETRAMP family protein [Bacillus atrophaeus]MCY8963812.1 ETRAMP family protein [Bacillus atrophaeus]MCY9440168.1 ETRAMP family protein [Bacillus atrophaeus]MEC0648448.1 hypothetical protein [Bacillus atrophaeus]
MDHEVTGELPLEKPKKTKKVIWIISVCAVVALIIGGIYGYQVYKKNKKLEQLEAYSKKEESLVTDMTSLGVSSEEIINEVETTWHDVIFNDLHKVNGKYVSDFNDALVQLYLGYEDEGKISDLEDTQETIEKQIKSMKNHPSEFDDNYDYLLEIYKNVKQLSDLAIEPKGSLETYKQEALDTDNATSSAMDDYDLKKVTFKELKKKYE